MNLTVKMKLLPDAPQREALHKTFETFNAACNYIAEYAFREKCFSAFKMHYALYKTVRAAFPSLSSQFVVRAFKKVEESYKRDKKVQRTFKKYSAVVYDQRLLSFPNLSTASINTVDGRHKIAVVFGQYLSLEGKKLKGQADLVYQNGKFFLCVVIELPDGTPIDPKGILGVDKGIVNIATTSDGNTFSGIRIDAVRERTAKIRQTLQKHGSKSAKRHLKKIGGRQARFQKLANHCISKEIVSIAKGTNRGIALENLKGISSRTRFRKADRQRFGNWAFFQLDTFIGYKAKLAGVPVVFVDPRNTSRECSACGHIAKSNRKSQSLFSCGHCGSNFNADLNAAINISRRAVVNQPIAVHLNVLSTAPSPGTAMPRQLAAG
jgi:IS605 OrfB family transposase